MNSKKKLISLTMFDFLRGVGIILVLVKHSIHVDVDSNLLCEMAYTVLMPIFFIVSGYWLKKRSFWEGFVFCAKSYLVPYLVVMGLINFVGLLDRWFVIGDIREWFGLFLKPSLLVYSGAGTRIGAMWFIFSLFVGWTMVYALLQMSSEKIRNVVSLLICFIGTIVLPFKLPFQLGQGMIAQFFIYLGYLIKKKKFLEKQLSVSMSVLLLIAWMGGGYLATAEKRCDLAFYMWGNGFPAVLFCLCGCYLLIYYGIRINQFENGFIEKVGLLGRYTFWIICIHSFEAAVVPWKYLFRFIPEDSIQGTLAQLALRSLFIYCGYILIKNILRRRQYVEQNH